MLLIMDSLSKTSTTKYFSDPHIVIPGVQMSNKLFGEEFYKQEYDEVYAKCRRENRLPPFKPASKNVKFDKTPDEFWREYDQAQEDKVKHAEYLLQLVSDPKVFEDFKAKPKAGRKILSCIEQIVVNENDAEEINNNYLDFPTDIKNSSADDVCLMTSKKVTQKPRKKKKHEDQKVGHFLPQTYEWEEGKKAVESPIEVKGNSEQTEETQSEFSSASKKSGRQQRKETPRKEELGHQKRIIQTYEWEEESKEGESVKDVQQEIPPWKLEFEQLDDEVKNLWISKTKQEAAGFHFKPSEKISQVVKISGLPLSSSPVSVFNLFSCFGFINAVTCFKASPRHLTALVEFQLAREAEQAQTLLNFRPLFLHDACVFVEVCRFRTLHKPREEFGNDARNKYGTLNLRPLSPQRQVLFSIPRRAANCNIISLFEAVGAPEPTRVHVFREQLDSLTVRGILDFGNIQAAVFAVLLTNYAQLPGGHLVMRFYLYTKRQL